MSKIEHWSKLRAAGAAPQAICELLDEFNFVLTMKDTLKLELVNIVNQGVPEEVVHAPDDQGSPERTLDYMAHMLPEALKLDGFDAALIGIVDRADSPTVLLYDAKKCIEGMMAQGMTYDEAWDYFQFNTLGSCVGEHTPAFATLNRDIAN